MKNAIIFLFILSIGLESQAQKAMSVEDCRKMALEHNKELKVANLQTLEAKQYVEVAKTGYRPSLAASLGTTYIPGIGDLSTPGSFLQTAESAEAAQRGEFTGESDVWAPGFALDMSNLTILQGNLSVSQPIYTGGRLKYGNKQAKAGVELYEKAFDVKYAEIIEQTDEAYWNMAKIASNVQLAKEYIIMLTELEDQMREMEKAGLTPGSETLMVSVQKNEAELNLLRAENSLRLAKMFLNHLLGQDIESDILLTDSLPQTVQLANVDYGVQMAMTNRSEIRILEKRMEISEYEKMIEQADYLPEAGVSVGYMANYLYDLTDDVQFNPIIGAQVSIPIFQWGQAKYKAQAADFRTMQIATELDNTNKLIELEVQNVAVQLEEAQQAILLAQKSVEQAEENLSETQASFEVGLNTTSELLRSKADWQNAKTQLINALSQYKILETTWERVTGRIKRG